ncbi:unnamed protein product [Rotaria sordida]|uniref:Phospholipid scramblase n=1 Tax=Rotaria sordida TaxID=392033 RepID=A0A814VJ33_9BILA|nr:unnamed protein product [Rotaria sordida]CAF1186125.1 unnamed protein product [Rotaria sordida]CAF3776774.1 unnamed protein product [Rotaria sordida]
MAKVNIEQPRDSNQPIPQMFLWMPSPGLADLSPGLPLGLQYLAQLDTLMAIQEPSVMQTITGLSSAQRFHILNQQGQLVFYAVENESDTCHRWCCGANRAFVIHVFDQMNQEIIRISREFKCCVGCCWCASGSCCAHEAFIESPPGVHIGTVRQTRSFWRGHLSLTDAGGNEHLRVIGPCCICQGVFCCCCENKFTIYGAENNGDGELGAIYKEYAGFVNQAFTGAEKYTIKFPASLPIQMKAVALGALFLVNFMYFAGNAEQKGGSSLLSLLG